MPQRQQPQAMPQLQATQRQQTMPQRHQAMPQRQATQRQPAMPQQQQRLKVRLSKHRGLLNIIFSKYRKIKLRLTIIDICNLDCPEGYDCPQDGSTDGCIIMNGNFKTFHPGCYRQTSMVAGAGPEPSNATHCAGICDDDSNCKGFTLNYGLCILATETECSLVNNGSGFIRFPKGNSNGRGASLLKDPQFPSKYFGYEGCYRKESYRKFKLIIYDI